jgi:methylmalonyl-CoA/ethylmalonyl-CoA epimerase
MTTKINHIAIAVENLDNSAYFWHELLGLPFAERRVVESEGVEVAFLQAGAARLELIQPLTDNGVQRFLEKRGGGIHHLCLEVDDITATVLQLRTAQIPLLNEQPKQHADGTQYVFIHPRGTGGVLVELYQLPAITTETP